MYKVDNKRIGKYLSKLIDNSRFKNDRQFSIAYLHLTKTPESTENIQNMQNRICQIKKGNKSIQIYDLPVFAELLGVSTDDILSAGTVKLPTFTHKTNYSIAFSKEPKEIENYINREDKLFLNPDEYNKTFIDYALEAENYTLLKYLMDHNYIWFVGDNSKEYYCSHRDDSRDFESFGAGTSIKRRELHNIDLLEFTFKHQCDLRYKMISLALKEKDLEMLNKLHAKEVPFLYRLDMGGSYVVENFVLSKTKNFQEFIETIVGSDNSIINYFFEPFTIKYTHLGHKYNFKNIFIAPFTGKILEALIINHQVFESKIFLQKAINHNQKMKNIILKNIADYKQTLTDYHENQKYYIRENIEDIINADLYREYMFCKDNGFIRFSPFFLSDPDTNSSIITNIINVTVNSKDSEIQFLIDELNQLYFSLDEFNQYNRNI
ncbi:hypothetical protein [Solobacterium moorei]|uniref:Uncharacterized protein n=1 Tax=Solobacterium moorei F0204 TaxID=706433 RepID=E7MLT2_9FIRM|nr:hypothetical protein [Solobacterium moorei]EFW24938.1 hypothetical protein HMPREF9430_00495 [Solobacterium moorei F0204]